MGYAKSMISDSSVRHPAKAAGEEGGMRPITGGVQEDQRLLTADEECDVIEPWVNGKGWKERLRD